MLRKTLLSTMSFCLMFLFVDTQSEGSPGNDSTSSDNGTLERIVSGIDLLHEGKFAEAAEKFQLRYVSSQKLSFEKLSRSSKVASSAFRYLKSGRFPEAAASFQEATDANYVEGEILMVSTALAVAVFDSCRDASLLATKANLLLKQGRFNESVETFQQARAKSNISEAVSTFDNCIDAVTIASAGRTLVVDGYFEKAADIFKRAYEASNVDPVSFTLFNFKTQCHLAKKGLYSLQNGFFDNASESFQTAFEISTVPSFYNTFAEYRDAANEAKLGTEFLRQGMFSNALSNFQNAFNKTRVNNLGAYVSVSISAIRGYELLSDNKTLEARSHFEKALTMRNHLLADDVEVLENCRDTLRSAAEGQVLMTGFRLHEALSKFREGFSKSTVREVKYLLSSYEKMPYEGESYCSRDHFAARG